MNKSPDHIFLLLSALFLAFIICTNCTSHCSNNDWEYEDDNIHDVWEDSKSGLMWEVRTYYYGSYWHPDCKKYCKNLKLKGYNDWRMPSISELRTLIRGCPATETDGECGITDNCLSEEDCWTEACFGCDWDSGPNPE